MDTLKLAFLDQQFDTVSRTVYNYTVDMGYPPGSTGRRFYVIGFGWEAAGARTLNSMTLNGSTITIRATNSNAVCGATMSYDELNTGSGSVTLTATLSAAVLRAHFALWRLDTFTANIYTEFKTSSADPATVTENVLSDGGAVCVYGYSGSPADSANETGYVEEWLNQPGSSTTTGGSQAIAAPGEMNRTLTLDWLGGAADARVAFGAFSPTITDLVTDTSHGLQIRNKVTGY